MKHLGDITKISGYTAPIVDCIIGGSPCQGLSVAGLGLGLDDERSGLYIEQVRIVKEMREQDERNGRTGVDIRPRYMVWENVPGAFSSNEGEDFKIVLEELAKVADKDAVIPMPDKGKWTNCGCIMGDGWSIAWRVLDAQFWGVPQRRRRIALVADFGGQSAPEILFVRNSVSGHTEPSRKKRKVSSPDATGGFGADDRLGADQYNGVILGDTVSTIGVNCGMSHGRQCVLEPFTFEPGIASREGGHVYEGVSGTLRANAGDNQMATAYTMQDREGKAGGGKGALIAEELSATLRANNAQYLFQPVYSVENHPNDSRVGINEDGLVQTLSSRMGTGGGNVPMVMEAIRSDRHAVVFACSSKQQSLTVTEGKANTLGANDYKEPQIIALDRASFNQGKNAQFDFEVSDKGINSPIVAKGPSAVCYGIYEENILLGKIKRLYAMNPVGGALHIVLDDENIEGKHILWCLRETIPKVEDEEERKLSEDIANELLKMTEDDREDLMELFWRPKTQGINGDKAGTLDASYYKGCGMRSGMEREVVAQAVDCRNCTEDDINGSLQSNSAHSLNGNNVVRIKYIVRRLTPLECERLQGYPDGWTDIGDWVDTSGKKRQTSDAARYKALGNSIALPPWKWVLKRLCACYERDATMASLFDGIGGFPYLWEQINGKGSCLWASEIEEFPMAVTKVRIGE